MIVPQNVAVHLLILCLFAICAQGKTSFGINSNDLDYFQRNEKDKGSLFNSFNQYTVDQLLVKVPSILEEPDTSDSHLDVSLKKKEPTSSESTDQTAPVNQNVFQNETTPAKPFTTTSPEHNLLAKSNSRYRSIKRLLSQITFNCSGRPEGYYSDQEFECRIFHYCKKNGFKFTFICPGNAVFNQEELTCDSAMRNPERTCRSSENYYFLNSVLYSKGKAPPSEAAMAASTMENITDNKNEQSDADFGKWVTYISTGTVIPVTTSTIKVPSKPKRNKVHFRKQPLQPLPSMQDVKIITQLPKTITKPKMEKHSSELLYSEDSPESIPDFLMTSPAPPMEQIDTPRWFPSKNASNDLVEHVNLESVNKYSRNSANSYVVTATVSTAPDEKIKQSSEATEVFNSIDTFPASNKVFKPTRQSIKAHHFSATPPAKHKISNPFQVGWDDDDQMLVEEFHKQGKVPHSIIKAPLNDESVNYLYGKPMEHIPSDQIQFSPVEFESLLAKMPQEVHTMPIMPPLRNHQRQMMSNFGQFASMAPSGQLPSEALQLIHTMGVAGNGAGAGNHKSKSQIQLLFGNLIGNGHNKIGRRWLQRGHELPLIWPLTVEDGIGRRHENGDQLMRPQPSYFDSNWNRFEPAFTPNISPLQVIELQRRSDRGDPPRWTPGWKSSFTKFLSKLTTNQNKQSQFL